MKITFINYYPKTNSGHKPSEGHSIEMILKPLRNYLSTQNVEIEEINLDGLSISPCEGCTQDINFIPTTNCEHINDDMNSLYPILRESDIWIFAISLNNKSVPKKVNNFIDRLEPLFNTSETIFENSLTQLNFTNTLGKVFLLSTSEHWSKEVFNELSNQIQSVALLFSKDYFGEILRPHFGVFASKLEQDSDFAEMINSTLSKLAKDLVHSSSISNGYLEDISGTLISKSEYDKFIEKILKEVV